MDCRAEDLPNRFRTKNRKNGFDEWCTTAGNFLLVLPMDCYVDVSIIICCNVRYCAIRPTTFFLLFQQNRELTFDNRLSDKMMLISRNARLLISLNSKSRRN